MMLDSICCSIYMYYLRDHKAVVFGSQEVELQGMPDAAWPVNGGDIGHDDVQKCSEACR